MKIMNRLTELYFNCYTCSKCKEYKIRIKELDKINDIHCRLNGKLRESIAVLEEKAASMMGRREYEEYYGEKVVYCNRHHMSSIDSCLACEEEEDNEPIICATCHYQSYEREDFMSVIVEKIDASVCYSCYDRLGKYS